MITGAPDRDAVRAHPAGYLDRWSAFPGDSIAVHATGEGDATLALVRLHGLVGSPVPTAYDESVVGEVVPLTLTVRDVPMGSWAGTTEGPEAAAGDAWEWRLTLNPTRTDGGTVLAWGHDGPRLALDAGHLVATWGSASLRVRVDAHRWSDVEFSASADGTLSLAVRPLGPDAWHRTAARATAPAALAAVSGPLAFGRGLSGKLGAPALTVQGAPVAAWHFADGMTTQQVPGRGAAARPLVLHQAPRRAVTGAAWDGSAHDWRTTLAHYDAIHFHDDDLADCGWPVTHRVALPPALPSGLYAIRLASAHGLFHLPFVVRARTPGPVAFLASTFTWLAYGSSPWGLPDSDRTTARFPLHADLALRFGLSTYMRHRDGSGIGLVSQRRPILTGIPGLFGEPHGGQVTANDDLRVLSWLGGTGIAHDVISDHDLHAEGAAALDGVRALVVGGHPEYHSRESLDALHAFVARGGRLLYLGGNGFYWRVSPLPDAPHVLELRRAEGGVRIWAEPPGEYHHQGDGALGGLWRRIGRPPNQLVGIGFSAQGTEEETRPYARTAHADDPRVAWLFEGVRPGLIGTEGPIGAAAGYELDRADVSLGTPPHALVVARSLPFGPRTVPVNEERLTHETLAAPDPVRADMTFFEGPNGGAVLGMGSLLFPAALAEADGTGRVALNALRRFADPTPFPPPPGA